jgi:hypothetical protein
MRPQLPGMQNLDGFDGISLLRKAGRWGHHPGKFLEIFRDVGHNGQPWARREIE